MASAGTLDAPPTRPAPRPRRRRGAAVLGAVVVLAALAAGGLAVLGGDAPPRPATVPVTRGSVVADVRAEGSVLSADSSSVSFTTDGVVATVEARVGAVVRTGDVLAGLDDGTTRPRVAAATAAVTADERAREAAGRVPVPDPVAIARLDASLAASRAALAEATAALDAGVLRAPQDGTVTAVGARPGDRVGAGSPPAVEIADLDALVVRVPVAPADVAAIIPGRTATVAVADAPAERGRVVDVAPTPGPDGRYVVVVSAPLPVEARIGIAARAVIVLARRDGVLVVPPTALRPAAPGAPAGSATVLVARPQELGGAVPTTVGVGLVGRDGVEVRGGLAVGDMVVVADAATDP